MLTSYLLQLDVSNLEPEDDDPQQTKDQRPVTINHVLWTNQIYPDLTRMRVTRFFRVPISVVLKAANNINIHAMYS